MPVRTGRRAPSMMLGALALAMLQSVALAQEEGGSAAPAGGADPASGTPTTGAGQAVPDLDQPSPFYLRLSQAVVYDDNVYRLPDLLPATSDWISSTALLTGFDQPFGRQRAFGNATLRANAYRDESQLNNFGYDLGLGLDWSSVERLSGDLRLNAAQSLARFSQYGSAPREATGKNLERSQVLGARVQYGITADWALEALLNYTNVDFSAAEFRTRERHAFTYGGGVRWRPSGIWNFGLGARRTDGRYPHASRVGGVFVADDYTRDAIDLTARYNYSGLSTFRGRLSYMREEHELETKRDFTGWTGELRWDYRPTGKLAFGAVVLRDTGTNLSATNVSGTQTFLTDARLSNRLGLDARWDATAKIRLIGGFDFWRDSFDDQFTQVVVGNEVISAVDQKTDNYRFSLSARYAPTRTLAFECGGRHEKRDSAVSVVRTIYGFTATTWFCNGTLALRG